MKRKNEGAVRNLIALCLITLAVVLGIAAFGAVVKENNLKIK